MTQRLVDGASTPTRRVRSVTFDNALAGRPSGHSETHPPAEFMARRQQVETLQWIDWFQHRAPHEIASAHPAQAEQLHPRSPSPGSRQ